MAQQQKPKESEWVDIPDPNEWKDIPDPTVSQEVGPPIPANYKEPQKITEPTDYWSGVAKSITSGDAMRTADQSAKGWMQGAVLDLPHSMWEGAKMLATANPIGYAAYHAMGHDMPAEETGKGVIPALENVWDLGVHSATKPYEFGRALGQLTGQPAMGEAAFGNIPGIPSAWEAGKSTIKTAGIPVEAVGRVMRERTPISGIGSKAAGAAAGGAYGGGGGAVAGAIYARAPRVVRGIESGIGGLIERTGRRMRDIDGSLTQAEIDEFWGGEKPDFPTSSDLKINEAPSGPFDRTPFNTPDAESVDLDQFRQGTNRNAWDPEETTINENTDPILESPINPPDSEIDALRQLHQSSTGRWQPPPATINEAPLGPFDRAPLSEESAPPEPPDMPTPPVAEGPPVNTNTGSAFERAMQQKAAAERAAGRDPSVVVGEEAPQVNAAGEPVPELSFDKPPKLPKLAKGQEASFNPDGDIQWPGVPNAKVIKQIEVQGYKFDPKTNVFKKQGLWERFLGEDRASFSHQELLENLTRMYGRAPTEAEIAAAIRSMPKPGEKTGQVAQFLKDESGTFDPVTMWKNIREYFNDQPSRNVDDWRQALIRAGAAGDEEAIRIISAHVRELEQQTSPPVSESNTVDDAGGTDWIPEPEPQLPPARTMGEHATEASNDIAQQQHVIDVPSSEQSLISGEPNVLSSTEFEPDPTHPANRPATIVTNHPWQLWDLMDRWSNLQDSARDAGDFALRDEIRGHIADLDQQMNHMRSQPFGTGNVEVLDPTPFEQANAHLPTPANPHTYGASFPQSVRDYVPSTSTQPSPLIPYTPGVRSVPPARPPTPSIASRPLSNRPGRIATRSQVQQQMDTLGVPAEQEQWYRALNDESLKFPEEGTQPTQDILGLREINSLGEIENARLTDPDFGWTEPSPPKYSEPEGMWQRGLKLRKPLKYTSADIDQLEIDLRNAPSNSLGEEYGMTGKEYGAIGKPGLEVKKYGNRVAAYWRGKDGKVTAIARGGERGIDSLSGKKIKADVNRYTRQPIKKAPGTAPSSGIGGGRGNFEVLEGLVNAGVPMKIDSSLSPYSRGMIETFIKQARKALAEEHK